MQHVWGKEVSYNKIAALYKKKGYAFFKGDYNLNIFGVRSISSSSVVFDDLLGCAYQHDGDCVFLCGATLNPGTYWLQHLMDKGGAAVIKAGQYRGLWELGLFHQDLSLLQKGTITIHRDKNLDDRVDITPEISTGNYGIFLHQHFQGVEEATVIGKSSAGCVVPSRVTKHTSLMRLCEKQIPLWGNSFTFTVFTEADCNGNI